MDYTRLQDILFYARKMIPVPSGDEENLTLAMTALKNLSDYGFVIDKEGTKALASASKNDITDWYYMTADKLNELAGGNHTYRPFYPNFPEEVMEKSDLDLFLDQLTHYISFAVEDLIGISGHAWMPEGENKKEGVKGLEEHPLKVVATYRSDDKEGIAEMAADVFKNTLKSKLTPSPADINNIVNAYVKACPSWTKDANTVENRAVLTYLYSIAIKRDMDVRKMPDLVTKDYLRIAQYYTYMKENSMRYIGGEDFQSLSSTLKEQKVASLPNSMRKFIADGLESQKNLEEDVARNKGQWKAVFRLMHVGALKGHENLKDVAYKLRNNQHLVTFYSKIEKAFSGKHYLSALRMYASRPGEFIKNFNRLITADFKGESPEKEKAYAEELFKKTEEVFGKTRPEDLARLVSYLNSRTREDRLPVHNVKGKLVKSETVKAPIAKETAELFVKYAKEAIGKQIKTGVPMGKVYIDETLRNFPAPTEISDSTESMNKYPRGSRLPIERNEDGTLKKVRAYVWWTNLPSGSRVDLDLSAVLYKKDEAGKYIDKAHIAFHDTYRHSNACVHSGDITDGGRANGKGVAEFVDIDPEALKNDGISKVSIFINSYTGQPFKNIPCLGGWQERDETDKSKQFDIKAVKQACKLGGNSTATTMCVLDIDQGEIIWLDSPALMERYCTSLDSISQFEMDMDRYAKGDQLSLFELAEIAVKANEGEIVDNMEDADVIFSADSVEDAKEEQRVITAKDQDIWIGEFLSPQEMVESEGADAENPEDVLEHEESDSLESAMYDEDAPEI